MYSTSKISYSIHWWQTNTVRSNIRAFIFFKLVVLPRKFSVPDDLRLYPRVFRIGETTLTYLAVKGWLLASSQ